MTGMFLGAARIAAAFDIPGLAASGRQAAATALEWGKQASVNFARGFQTSGGAQTGLSRAVDGGFRDIQRLASQSGKLAADNFLSGLNAVRSGNPADSFQAATNAMTGVIDIATNAGQAITDFGDKFTAISGLAQTAGAAIGIAGDALATYTDTAGQYLSAVAEIGDTYLQLRRTLAASTLDMAQVDGMMVATQEIMASGAVDHFDDVAQSIGRFARALQLGGTDLQEFVTTYASMSEVLGTSVSPTNIAGVLNAFAPTDEAQRSVYDYNEELTRFTNIIRATGGNAQSMVDSMIRVGPAMRLLGYDAGGTALFFGGLLEKGLRGQKLVYGMNQIVEQMHAKVADGSFKDLDDAFGSLLKAVQDLQAAGKGEAAVALLSEYTTPANASLLNEAVARGIIADAGEMGRRAGQNFDQNLQEAAAETSSLGDIFENITQAFEASLAPVGLALNSFIVSGGTKLIDWMAANTDKLADWAASVANFFITGFEYIIGGFSKLVGAFANWVNPVVEGVLTVVQLVFNAVRLTIDAIGKLTNIPGVGKYFEPFKAVADVMGTINEGMDKIRQADLSKPLRDAAAAGDALVAKLPNVRKALSAAAYDYGKNVDVNKAFSVIPQTDSQGNPVVNSYDGSQKMAPAYGAVDIYKRDAAGKTILGPDGKEVLNTAWAPMLQMTGSSADWERVKSNLKKLSIDISYDAMSGVITTVQAADEEARRVWQNWYDSRVKAQADVYTAFVDSEGNPVDPQSMADDLSGGTATVKVQMDDAYLQNYLAQTGLAIPGVSVTAPSVGALAAPAVLKDQEGVQSSQASIYAATAVAQNFPQVKSIGGGRRTNTAPNTHDIGQAIDIAIPNDASGNIDMALGDRINEWLRTNAAMFNIKYTIWRDIGRFIDGSKPAFRSPGHFDHIDVQFNDGGVARLTPAGTTVTVPNASPFTGPAVPGSIPAPAIPMPAPAMPMPGVPGMAMPGTAPLTAPPPAPPGGWTPQAVAALIYRMAIERGYSDRDARAIVAYAVGESGLDPTISGGVQGGNGDPYWDQVIGLFQQKPDFARRGGIDPALRGDPFYNTFAYLNQLQQNRNLPIEQALAKTSVGGPLTDAGRQDWGTLLQRANSYLGAVPAAASVPMPPPPPVSYPVAPPPPVSYPVPPPPPVSYPVAPVPPAARPAIPPFRSFTPGGPPAGFYDPATGDPVQGPNLNPTNPYAPVAPVPAGPAAAKPGAPSAVDGWQNDATGQYWYYQDVQGNTYFVDKRVGAPPPVPENGERQDAPNGYWRSAHGVKGYESGESYWIFEPHPVSAPPGGQGGATTGPKPPGGPAAPAAPKPSMPPAPPAPPAPKATNAAEEWLLENFTGKIPVPDSKYGELLGSGKSPPQVYKSSVAPPGVDQYGRTTEEAQKQYDDLFKPPGWFESLGRGASAVGRALKAPFEWLGEQKGTRQIGDALGWLWENMTPFADGGMLDGPAGMISGRGGPRDDSVLARLSNGEYVVRASMVDKHYGLIDAINNDRLPRFSEGGEVTPEERLQKQLLLAAFQGKGGEGAPPPERSALGVIGDFLGGEEGGWKEKLSKSLQNVFSGSFWLEKMGVDTSTEKWNEKQFYIFGFSELTEVLGKVAAQDIGADVDGNFSYRELVDFFALPNAQQEAGTIASDEATLGQKAISGLALTSFIPGLGRLPGKIADAARMADSTGKPKPAKADATAPSTEADAAAPAYEQSIREGISKGGLGMLPGPGKPLTRAQIGDVAKLPSEVADQVIGTTELLLPMLESQGGFGGFVVPRSGVMDPKVYARFDIARRQAILNRDVFATGRLEELSNRLRDDLATGYAPNPASAIPSALSPIEQLIIHELGGHGGLNRRALSLSHADFALRNLFLALHPELSIPRLRTLADINPSFPKDVEKAYRGWLTTQFPAYTLSATPVKGLGTLPEIGVNREEIWANAVEAVLALGDQASPANKAVYEAFRQGLLDMSTLPALSTVPPDIALPIPRDQLTGDPFYDPDWRLGWAQDPGAPARQSSGDSRLIMPNISGLFSDMRISGRPDLPPLQGGLSADKFLSASGDPVILGHEHAKTLLDSVMDPHDIFTREQKKYLRGYVGGSYSINDMLRRLGSGNITVDQLANTYGMGQSAYMGSMTAVAHMDKGMKQSELPMNLVVTRFVPAANMFGSSHVLDDGSVDSGILGKVFYDHGFLSSAAGHGVYREGNMFSVAERGGGAANGNTALVYVLPAGGQATWLGHEDLAGGFANDEFEALAPHGSRITPFKIMDIIEGRPDLGQFIFAHYEQPTFDPLSPEVRDVINAAAGFPSSTTIPLGPKKAPSKPAPPAGEAKPTDMPQKGTPPIVGTGLVQNAKLYAALVEQWGKLQSASKWAGNDPGAMTYQMADHIMTNYFSPEARAVAEFNGKGGGGNIPDTFPLSFNGPKVALYSLLHMLKTDPSILTGVLKGGSGSAWTGPAMTQSEILYVTKNLGVNLPLHPDGSIALFEPGADPITAPMVDKILYEADKQFLLDYELADLGGWTGSGTAVEPGVTPGLAGDWRDQVAKAQAAGLPPGSMSWGMADALSSKYLTPSAMDIISWPSFPPEFSGAQVALYTLIKKLQAEPLAFGWGYTGSSVRPYSTPWSGRDMSYDAIDEVLRHMGLDADNVMPEGGLTTGSYKWRGDTQEVMLDGTTVSKMLQNISEALYAQMVYDGPVGHLDAAAMVARPEPDRLPKELEGYKPGLQWAYDTFGAQAYERFKAHWQNYSPDPWAKEASTFVSSEMTKVWYGVLSEMAGDLNYRPTLTNTGPGPGLVKALEMAAETWLGDSEKGHQIALAALGDNPGKPNLEFVQEMLRLWHDAIASVGDDGLPLRPLPDADATLSPKAQEIAEAYKPAGLVVKTMDQFFADHVPDGAGPIDALNSALDAVIAADDAKPQPPFPGDKLSQAMLDDLSKHQVDPYVNFPDFMNAYAAKEMGVALDDPAPVTVGYREGLPVQLVPDLPAMPLTFRRPLDDSALAGPLSLEDMYERLHKQGVFRYRTPEGIISTQPLPKTKSGMIIPSLAALEELWYGDVLKKSATFTTNTPLSEIFPMGQELRDLELALSKWLEGATEGYAAQRTPGPGMDFRAPPGSGDGWVLARDGSTNWGKFGAAGLLLRAPTADGPAILLQHRASWSDQGGTWSLPGGALDGGETPIDAAIREAYEEAGLTPDQFNVSKSLVTKEAGVYDSTQWRYTTVVADAPDTLPVKVDSESKDLRWVPVAEIDALPLHPAFAEVWPLLRQLEGFSEGGEVFGAGTATSDSIPAWLSTGEFVQSAAAVSHYGKDFMHRVNQRQVPRFNTGGDPAAPGLPPPPGPFSTSGNSGDLIIGGKDGLPVEIQVLGDLNLGSGQYSPIQSENNPFANPPRGPRDEVLRYVQDYVRWQQEYFEVMSQAPIELQQRQTEALKDYTDKARASAEAKLALDQAIAARDELARINKDTAVLGNSNAQIESLTAAADVAERKARQAKDNLLGVEKSLAENRAAQRNIVAEGAPQYSPKGAKAESIQPDRYAERLGAGLVTGLLEGLGFPEPFGKAIMDWGIYKMAMGGLGFGINLAQTAGVLPAPGQGGAQGLGPGVAGGLGTGAIQTILPGVPLPQLPGQNVPAVAPSAAVTPAMAATGPGPQGTGPAPGPSPQGPLVQTNINMSGITSDAAVQTTMQSAVYRSAANAPSFVGGAGTTLTA